MFFTLKFDSEIELYRTVQYDFWLFCTVLFLFCRPAAYMFVYWRIPHCYW